jgi:rhodanese-related sulfurtransferase
MKWISMAIFVLSALPACAKPEVAALSVDQVEARLGEKGFYVLDCNAPEMYRGAHVPGAKRVDYHSLQPSDLPADKAATLVFYCTSEH